MTSPKVIHVASIDLTVRFLLLNQLLFLKKEGYEVGAVCSDGPWVAGVRQRGIPVTTIQISRVISPWQDLKTLRQLYAFFRRERPTIVHTHTPKPGLLGQLAARFAGVPVVVNTVHGFYFHDNMHWLGRRFYIAMEKIAALCSAVILSQNPEDVATAVREGICPPDKIKPLGNGIDIGHFDPARFSPREVQRKKRELGIADGHKVVGMVGRLVREKGLLEFFGAARAVRREFPAVKFLVVGPIDADKPDALTPDVAGQYGLREDVIFLGMRTDMPELYSVMDLLVLPSHREGFPRSPMEASAMGVPVIATDIRGCREVVKEGRNGLLVPLKDEAALAAAILRLLGDEELAARLGRTGMEMARELFDERLVFRRVSDEYRRLLASREVEA